MELLFAAVRRPLVRTLLTNKLAATGVSQETSLCSHW